MSSWAIRRLPSDDAGELDVAVGKQHCPTDQQDLHHRDRGDGRIDLPFEILQDDDRQGGGGKVRRQKVTRALAPRFCAASSMLRSTPARLAVTSRTTQGMTITIWPD